MINIVTEKTVYCMYFKKEIDDCACTEYLLTAANLINDEERRAEIESIGMTLEDFKCENCPVYLAGKL